MTFHTFKVSNLNIFKMNSAFIYHWNYEEEEAEDESKNTLIRIYGLDTQDKSICLTVRDFTPYVYLELPTTHLWNADLCQKIKDQLSKKMGSSAPLRASLQYKKKLYFCHRDVDNNDILFPYLCLVFSSQSAIRKLGYILKKEVEIPFVGKIQMKMHESNANPVLQLVCFKDLYTAGWVKYRGIELFGDKKETSCDREFSVNSKNLQKDDRQELGNPLIMGFDIEVNSTNPNRMPVPEEFGNKVFQISCVFFRADSKEFQKFLLTLGECDVFDPEVEIRMYPTECDLLLGFRDIIQEFNPQILTGYNILGFDIDYLIKRCKEPCDYLISEFSKLGYVKNKSAPEKTISWSSSAYKDQNFVFLDIQGRILVDLLPVIKRDYKLSQYNLKTVSDYFLGETKDDLSPKGIFKCYRLGMEGGENGRKALSLCGKYCTQDTMLVVKLFQFLKVWPSLCEMAKICYVPIFTLFTQGQQIKVFSQVYYNSMYNNRVVEQDVYKPNENEGFLGAYVKNPEAGIYENVIPFDFCLTGDTMVDMAGGYLQRLDQISLGEFVVSWSAGFCISRVIGVHPNGKRKVIKVIFKDLTELRCTPDHKILTVSENNEFRWISAIDLIVKDKIVGYLSSKYCEISILEIKEDGEDFVYDISVENTKSFVANNVVVSNCSLYPCTIISYNLDYSTLVLDESVPDEKCHVFDFDEHQNCEHVVSKPKKGKKIICAHRKYRFIKEPKGVLPTIIQNLLDTRKVVKNEMKSLAKQIKESPNPASERYLDVLDKRQLALKISANSVIPNTPIPCQINGEFDYLKIKNLSDGNWVIDEDGNEISKPIQGLKVWSDTGYTDVKFVFRHHISENVKTVITHHGCVTCTNDHSLLDQKGNSVKPVDLKIGDSLLHHRRMDFLREYLKFHNDYDVYNIGTIQAANLYTDEYYVKKLKNGKYSLEINDDISSDQIIKIKDEFYEGYVYDIETENHHFAAGIGDLIVHNSMYGATGVTRGYLPMLPVASTTTYMGRVNIKLTSDYLQNIFKAKVIYSDTDSCYCTFDQKELQNPTKLWDHCVYVASEISKMFPSPMQLEFESVIYSTFLILTMKRYMSLKCDRDGNISEDISKKGVLLARRDNSKFIRNLYEKIVKMIFERKEKRDIFYEIIQNFNLLFSGSFGFKDFVISKSVGDINNYKIKAISTDFKKRIKRFKDLDIVGECICRSDQLCICTSKTSLQFPQINHRCTVCKEYSLKALPAQAQLAEKLRNRGTRVDAGTRLEYLITMNGGVDGKQFEKIEDPAYQRKFSEIIKLDYLYYLKLCIEPFDQLLYVCFKEKDFVKKQYKVRLQKHKFLKDVVGKIKLIFV